MESAGSAAQPEQASASAFSNVFKRGKGGPDQRIGE